MDFSELSRKLVQVRIAASALRKIKIGCNAAVEVAGQLTREHCIEREFKRAILSRLVFAIYGLSFLLPAVERLDPPTAQITGFGIVVGVWGSMYGFVAFAVYAPNLMFFLGILFFILRYSSFALVCSLVSLLLALSFSLIPLEEEGLGLLVGYYLWVSAILLFSVDAGWHAYPAGRQRGGYLHDTV